MVDKAVTIKYQILDSEIEALLIEAELIKTHQPYFNSRLKDDKSNIYLLVTNEPFPRVLRLRKTDLAHKKYQKNLGVFGPFASSYRLQEVLKLIRPIFRWCNQPKQRKGKACLYHHLDLCSGACAGTIEQGVYQADITQLIAFLRGRKKELLKQLHQDMKQYAETEQYELALVCKQKIALIQEVTSAQKSLRFDLLLPSLSRSEHQEGLLQLRKLLHDQRLVPSDYQLNRIEGYDVSNTQGQQATVSLVVLTNGELDRSEYKLFNIRSLQTPNDYQMLQEALGRRQGHLEWPEPDLIMIDGGRGQVSSVKKVWEQAAPVIGIVKNPDRLVIGDRIIRLPQDHPSLKLLQQLRDEAHRFAKKQHSRLRTKHLLQ